MKEIRAAARERMTVMEAPPLRRGFPVPLPSARVTIFLAGRVADATKWP